MIKRLIRDLSANSIVVSIAIKKCKLILTIVDDIELKGFLKSELEGYSTKYIPSYRKLIGKPIGTYRNRFNNRQVSIPLDFSQLNNKNGLDFNERRIPTSIVEIESLLAQSKGKGGEINVEFTSDQVNTLHPFTGADNDNGWYLESARWSFTENAFQGIYSQTENKLLDILIRINNENPNLDNQLSFMEEKDKSQSIQTTINGNVVSSAIGIGSEVSQSEITINHNQDIEKVIEKIIELGFDRSDTVEIEKLLLEKKKTGSPIGKEILLWVGKMTSKAIEKGIEYKIPELTALLSHHL